MYSCMHTHVYIYTKQTHGRKNAAHANTGHINNAPYQCHIIHDQPCSQRQGTLAAALTPLLDMLGSLLQDAAAGRRTAQEEEEWCQRVTHTGTSARHIGRCSAALSCADGEMKVC